MEIQFSLCRGLRAWPGGGPRPLPAPVRPPLWTAERTLLQSELGFIIWSPFLRRRETPVRKFNVPAMRWVQASGMHKCVLGCNLPAPSTSLNRPCIIMKTRVERSVSCSERLFQWPSGPRQHIVIWCNFRMFLKNMFDASRACMWMGAVHCIVLSRYRVLQFQPIPAFNIFPWLETRRTTARRTAMKAL